MLPLHMIFRSVIIAEDFAVRPKSLADTMTIVGTAIQLPSMLKECFVYIAAHIAALTVIHKIHRHTVKRAVVLHKVAPARKPAARKVTRTAAARKVTRKPAARKGAARKVTRKR